MQLKTHVRLIVSRHCTTSTEAEEYYTPQKLVNITGTYMIFTVSIYAHTLYIVKHHVSRSIRSWIIAPSTTSYHISNIAQIILLAHLHTENCTIDRTETRGAASRGSISTLVVWLILLAHLHTENCTIDRTETRGAASRGSISTRWLRSDKVWSPKWENEESNFGHT